MTSSLNTSDPRPAPHGRGSAIEPPNRFLKAHAVPDYADFENDPEFLAELRRVPTEFLDDASQSIVSENDSPDVPFRYSVNPYRGCEHGCAYCYARPYHEYLGLNAGIDFESKIFVKHRAPQLLRDWLARAAWRPEEIVFSGITDCYQPCERKFELTRQCLAVAAECHQPMSLITKNALVVRDLDILSEMATWNGTHVCISLTTLDAKLARTLEPRTSSPDARLRAIRDLSAAGVPVCVMTAPVIPGLNDSEIPALLEAASKAGAKHAGFVMLRLPLAVKPVFLEWLERAEPSKRDRVVGLLQSVRGGELNSSNFGERMRGTGEIADQIKQTFRVFARKHGLDQPLPKLNSKLFVPPKPTSGQLTLF
ncbi:MAG: PA0069 family radical SAM protein [Candidatus Saccharimonas sp.]|nr:PA0069 family radical SAM protein [Planctomycetaceae bacterium]